MELSTYIFVHNQQILLDNDVSGKFLNLPEMKYVFLGNGQTDKINNRADVIIARELEYNIEQYPMFCSFTGWYVLWKNNIIKSNYVNLFEYDIIVNNSFNDVVSDLIIKGYDFIGYVPISMKNTYIDQPKYLSGIIESIQKRYNINIKELVRLVVHKNRNETWSSTSNSTFEREIFEEYMNWFSLLVDDIKNDNMCGHAHERSISFFYLIFKKKILLKSGIISHMMLNSHKT